MAFILLGVRPINDGEKNDLKKENPNVEQAPVDGPSNPCDSREAPCAMVDGEHAKRMAEVKAQFKKLDKEMFERLEKKNFMGRLLKGQFNRDNFSELAECFGILAEVDCRLALIEETLGEGVTDTKEMPELAELNQHVSEFRWALDRMADDAETCMDRILGVDRDDEDGCYEDEDDYEDCDGDCDKCAYVDICDDADVSNDDDDDEGNTIEDDAEDIVAEFNKVINKVTTTLIRHDFRERLLNGKFTEDNYDEVVGLFTLQQRMVCLGEKAMSDLDDLLDECCVGDSAATDYIDENMGLIQENVDVAVKTMECLRLWMERVNGGIRVGDEEPSDSVLEKVSELKRADPNGVCKSFKKRLDSLTGPVNIEHSMVPSLDIVRECEPVTGSHNAMVEDNMSRATSFLEDLKVMLKEAVVYQGTLAEDSALYAMMDVIVDKMISMAEQLEEDIYTMTLWLAFADVQN